MIFNVLCFLIAAISAYDIYLTIKFEEALVEFNPLGRVIMRLDDNDIALFMALKFMGTVVCLSILQMLHWCNFRIAKPVVVGVFLFQLWLLCFLTIN